MSYNYLPLDRKRLSFQQVKNLLDYDQQVSITFDAHERILQCQKYLANKTDDGGNVVAGVDQSGNISKRATHGFGDEVPLPVIKLVIMLKIKSLSYGQSGVQIETVKRLMKMYNKGVFPVIYADATTSVSGGGGTRGRLALPLIGLTEVWYQGQKKASADVMRELQWQPLQLQQHEFPALSSGSQMITAYGMYVLKKTEHLLQVSNVVAALSFDVLGLRLDELEGQAEIGTDRKGEQQVAQTILQYLQEGGRSQGGKQPGRNPSSFNCVPEIHGAVKDQLETVLNLFLAEINSVSEIPRYLPEQDLVLTSRNRVGYPLVLAFDMLVLAMSAMSNISERRINRLSAILRSGPDENRAKELLPLQSLWLVAANINAEIKQMTVPASAKFISIEDGDEDFELPQNFGGPHSLRVIGLVEKVVGIELLISALAGERLEPNEKSPFLKQFTAELQRQVSFEKDNLASPDLLNQVTQFITGYRFKPVS